MDLRFGIALAAAVFAFWLAWEWRHAPTDEELWPESSERLVGDLARPLSDAEIELLLAPDEVFDVACLCEEAWRAPCAPDPRRLVG